MSQTTELTVAGVPEDELKMEKARHNADLYLEAYLGNMLYPSTPVKVLINGKEMYKVPIKSHNDNGLHTLGYLYLDSESLEVNKILSSGRDDIDKVTEEITKNESSLS